MTKEIYMFIFELLIKNLIGSLVIMLSTVCSSYIMLDIIKRHKPKYYILVCFLCGFGVSFEAYSAAEDFIRLIEFRVGGRIENKQIYIVENK